MSAASGRFVSDYGPLALVTGASEGIGAAFATDLAKRGLDLILVARREDRLKTLAETLRAAHRVEVQVIAADLGTEAGIAAVLAAAKGKEVGLYVGSAGFGTAGAFLRNDVALELNMIDVNCRALCALAHPLARSMQARGKGGIVLMSSIVAFQGVAGSANYAATKAYVQALAEGLAAELEPYGVDVLASAPGPVDTGFAARADMMMGSAATPEVVARATLAALGRRVTVRPGGQAKLLGYGLGLLPRGLRSRILGKIMTGMTRHRDAQSQTGQS
jgi:short-subunit dehydrogenase